MNDAPPDVKVNYEAADYRAMSWQCRKCRFRLALISALPLLFIVADAYLFGGGTIRLDVIAGAALLGLILFAAIFFLGGISQARAQRKGGFIEPFVFSLLEEGVSVSHPRQDMIVKWEGVQEVVRTKDRLFVLTSPGYGLILPRRSFDNEDAFRRWGSEAARRYESARTEPSSNR